MKFIYIRLSEYHVFPTDAIESSDFILIIEELYTTLLENLPYASSQCLSSSDELKKESKIFLLGSIHFL